MSTPDPVDLEPRQLLQIAADFFESNDIPYRVVGSMASIDDAYIERWAPQLKVDTEWQMVKHRLGKTNE